MVQRIPAPRKPLSDADAQYDCECAIDIPVRDLVDEIIQAGWPPKIVYSAMRDVIENQVLAYLEDPDPSDDPQERPSYETRSME